MTLDEVLRKKPDIMSILSESLISHKGFLIIYSCVFAVLVCFGISLGIETFSLKYELVSDSRSIAWRWVAYVFSLVIFLSLVVYDLVVLYKSVKCNQEKEWESNCVELYFDRFPKEMATTVESFKVHPSVLKDILSTDCLVSFIDHLGNREKVLANMVYSSEYNKPTLEYVFIEGKCSPYENKEDLYINPVLYQPICSMSIRYSH